MSSATFNLDTRHTARIALVVMSSTIILALVLIFAFIAAQRVEDQGPAALAAKKPQLALLSVKDDSSAWSAFFRRKSAGQGGKVGDKYRLAGTFFEFGASKDTRRAILDDIASGRQHIVSEGQSVVDLLVLSISSDHILVRAPSGDEEELWLSFRSGAAESVGTNATDASALAGDSQVSDDFGGKRVGEARWVFEREKLIGYYKELMSEPERLVKLFDSLKPLYTDNGKIEGYELEIFGEEKFFDSAGLKAGDVVRSVNSIEMTNRRRAEYLISEFVNDRVNVVVMDIERDGKPSKFIYQIR